MDTPPPVPDFELRTTALLERMLLACTIGGVIYLAATYGAGVGTPGYLAPPLTVLGCGLAWLAARQGRAQLAAIMATAGLVLSVNFGAINVGGPSVFPAYLPVLLLALVMGATVLKPRGVLLLAGAEIALAIGLFAAERAGSLPPAAGSFSERLPTFAVLILAISGIFVALVNHTLRESFDARRRSEERYRTLVDELPDGLLTVESTGLIRTCNPAAARMIGLQVEQVIGRHFSAVAQLDDPKAHEAGLRQAFATGAINGGMPVVNVRRPDGTRIAIETNTTMVRGPHGDELRVGLRDVTERVHNEQRRAELESELLDARRLEAVGRLAGGVAHDFNNLLTVILSTTHMLKTLGDDDPQPLVADVEIAASKAAEITSQLLAYARQQVKDPRPLDLNAHLEESESLVRRLLREDITLELALGQAVVPVFADPVQLQQVLVNLVANARQAMPDGGTLRIELSETSLSEPDCPQLPAGRYACLTVSDDGSGIDAEALDHIFEPFFSTKGDDGNGLGLATVYGIVKQNGGHVSVDSTSGAGTRFQVLLPWSEIMPEAPLTPTESSPPAGRATVLLVDDDRMVLTAVLRFLSATDFDVLHSDSPEGALQIARAHQHTIDLLITDVVMPGMDGRELASQLTRENPAMRVILTSGYTERWLDPASDVASAAWLAKPYSPRALVDKANELLAEARG